MGLGLIDPGESAIHVLTLHLLDLAEPGAIFHEESFLVIECANDKYIITGMMTVYG